MYNDLVPNLRVSVFSSVIKQVAKSLLLATFFLLMAGPFLAVAVQAADAEYEVMPLLPQGEGISEAALINSMIFDQGYEAHCANKQWVISKDIWGSLSSYFDPSSAENYWNRGAITFGDDSAYLADLSRAHVPLLRGMEPSVETMKNSSFEGFFGANTQLPEHFFSPDGSRFLLNASGVAERLLPAYHQCYYKKQNIDAIGRICSTIVGPCALNKKMLVAANPITGISSREMKILDIQDLFEQIRPNLGGEDLNRQVCFDLFADSEAKEQTNNYQPPTVSVSTMNLTQAAISSAPLDIDNLYRLAFLILVPQQDPDENQDKFYFLQSNANINARKHAPIFAAFKIPDFSTNKSYLFKNIDSLEITKQVLQSVEQNASDSAAQKEKRQQLQGKTQSASGQSTSGKAVDCDGLPQCERSSDNALQNTLVDLINSSDLNCNLETLTIVTDQIPGGAPAPGSSAIANIFDQEDLHYENAGDLYTPANKDIKEYDYVYDSNNVLINRLSSNEQEIFSWQLLVDEPEPELGENIVVNAYLVLPIGESVKDANKALTIFWNKDTFVEMIRENTLIDMMGKQGVIPKFYTFKGENATFKASDSFPFCSRYETTTEVDANGQAITTYSCADEKSVGVSLTDNKKSLLFPDFGLGWLIRQIQTTIRSTANETYEYVKSCQRIEDLFLGRCGGASSGQLQSVCDGAAFAKVAGMPSAGGVPGEAQDYFNGSIASRVTQELIDAYSAAEEATGIPCEVAAGIHWTEGGMNAGQSLLDGGSLRGGDIRSDAIAAMNFLKGIIEANGGNTDNLDYAILVTSIAQYNGLGNKNCSIWNQDIDGQSGPRPTRWRSGGKCNNVEPPDGDQPHPTAWIDDYHTDMDLIFCQDAVEFSCNQSPASANINAIKNRIRIVLGITDEAELERRAQQAVNTCFQGSAACNTSSGSKYPPYARPGSLTVAILLHAAGN